MMVKFTEVRKGVWESDRQAYTAAALNHNREPIGIKEAAWTIQEGTKKDATVYRVYRGTLVGYRFEKTFKTLDKAIKFVNDMYK